MFWWNTPAHDDQSPYQVWYKRFNSSEDIIQTRHQLLEINLYQPFSIKPTAAIYTYTPTRILDSTPPSCSSLRPPHWSLDLNLHQTSSLVLSLKPPSDFFTETPISPLHWNSHQTSSLVFLFKPLSDLFTGLITETPIRPLHRAHHWNSHQTSSLVFLLKPLSDLFTGLITENPNRPLHWSHHWNPHQPSSLKLPSALFTEIPPDLFTGLIT